VTSPRTNPRRRAHSSNPSRHATAAATPRNRSGSRPATATRVPELPAPTIRDAADLPRTFADLPLPQPVLRAIAEQGLTELFPIQAATLPDSLAGRDVLGRGRTGSGKTLAFGLALLTRTAPLGRAAAGRPHALVLVPTRELAQQVTTSLAPYAAALKVRTATVVGGLGIERQIATLRAGVDVLVATPGRLEDLIARRACDLGGVRIAVLDEADQMADMGFLPVVTRLLDQVAPGGQRLLFSATLDGDVGKLVHRFMTDPVLHSADPVAATVDLMEHHVLHLDTEDKQAVTAEIAAGDSKVIMFVRTKHGADRLAKQLARVGVRAAAMHGGKSQNARTRALDWLKDGSLDALVATNVAARGIHIDGIDLVVNVDPPTEAKDYLHRGGRTARAGKSGTVVTLVLPEQRQEVRTMMASVGIKPETSVVRPGDEQLVQVTGARRPSGQGIVPPAQAAAQAAQANAARPARRRTAPAPAATEHRATTGGNRGRRPRRTASN
jgi:superfamily II DNA/RNA helicase